MQEKSPFPINRLISTRTFCKPLILPNVGLIRAAGNEINGLDGYSANVGVTYWRQVNRSFSPLMTSFAGCDLPYLATIRIMRGPLDPLTFVGFHGPAHPACILTGIARLNGAGRHPSADPGSKRSDL